MRAEKKLINKRTIASIICLVVVALILFPLLWMIPAAFKGKMEIWELEWFPKEWTINNFVELFSPNRQYNFLYSLGITFVVAALATFFGLFVNTLAAYAFARIDFPFKKILWVVYLFPMFVPGITILLTSLKVVNDLHMTDTIFVLFVPGIASAYQTFFFRQFFLGIPQSLEEAAELDGCNKFRIFFRVFLPMSKTPLIIQGVGIFLAHWNSYMWPSLTVTGNENLQQVMQIIRLLSIQNGNNYGIVIAACLICMIPPLIIFAILQKKIVEGVTLSGMK